MKKVLFFALISIIACNKAEEPEQTSVDYAKDVVIDVDSIVNSLTYFLEISVSSIDTSSINNIIEYELKDGLVISETYRKNYGVDPNYISTFEYDDKDRLIREIRDGKTYREIIWNNDTAEFYTLGYNRKCIFEGNKVKEYLTYDNEWNYLGGVNARYSTTGNLVAWVGQKSDTTVIEYCDFDHSVMNPYYAINSISLLKFMNEPDVKNMFKFYREFIPESYDYNAHYKNNEQFWTVNEKGMVDTWNDMRYVGITKFKYK